VIEEEKAMVGVPKPDWDSYQLQKADIMERKLKAQADYDMTPAGMLELARRLGQDRGSKKSEYALRLTAAKENRRTALAAIGKADVGDVKHERTARKHTYRGLPGTFLPFDEERVAMSPELAKESLRASRQWIGELEADEIEALAWITSNGAGILNGYLSTGEVPRGLDNRPLTPADLQKYIADGKRAIGKYQSKPVVLYRGESYFPALEKLYHIDEDPAERAQAVAEVAKVFPVGGTYEPDRFLSTSYDSGIGCDFSQQDVVLEIRSKTHGPVAAISAWANREREAIIAPGTKFKVVAIREDVLFQQSRPYAHNTDIVQERKIVVQLEEI
jgi:hypothetical protein